VNGTVRGHRHKTQYKNQGGKKLFLKKKVIENRMDEYRKEREKQKK